MKKYVILFMAICMIIGLTACGETSSEQVDKPTDWKDASREILKTDVPFAIDCLIDLSNELEKTILDSRWSDEDVKKIYDLHKKVLLLAAPHHFESYLLYLENQREPEKKFYPPRRKVLKQVVDALQDLADDKLDLLAISLPPGSGKITLAILQ